MAAISTYLGNKLLDHSLGSTAFTMPANVYVALYTSAQTAGNTGTETVYTNYARVQTNSGVWGAAAGLSKTNSVAAITFPACGATGATIVAWGILDASTAGNLLYFGTCSLTVSSGITPSFATSQLTISES